MWEYLDSGEIDRRLGVLKEYAAGDDSRADHASRILGLVADLQGDRASALAYWERPLVPAPERGPDTYFIRSTDQGSGYLVGRAGHPRTPATELYELFAEGDEDVLEEIAGNDAAPPELLRELASAPTDYVRLAVVNSVSCPPDVLRRLAWAEDEKEYSEFTWASIAAHPQCPLDVMEEYRTTVPYGREEYGSVLMGVAGNPGADEPMLIALSSHGDPQVRAAVAWNPVAAEELVLDLSFDMDPTVRRHAAASLALNPSRLMKMAVDEDRKVRAAVWANPRSPEEARVAAFVAGV